MKRQLYIHDEQNKNVEQHNYFKKLQDALKDVDLQPEVYDVEIAHDSWCAIHAGGFCNCDPDITIKKR